MTEFPSRPLLLAGATLLLILGPILAFPDLLPGTSRVLLINVFATIVIPVTIGLIRDEPSLRFWTTFLVAMVVVAWSSSAATQDSVSHFAGVMLGVLVMAVVYRWSVDRPNSAPSLAAGIVVLGIGALVVGASTVFVDPGRLAAVGLESIARLYQWLPTVELPLPGVGTIATPETTRQHVNPNALAVTALMVVFPAWALARATFRSSGTTLLLSVGAIGAFTASIVLLGSLSRGGIVAAVATIAVFTFARHARHRWATAMFAVIILMMSMTAILGDVRNLQVDSTSSQVSDTLSVRKAIWKESLIQIGRHPFRGAGLNVFHEIPWLYSVNTVSNRYEVAHAHNTFIQVALDVGIPGLVAYIGLLVTTLRRAGSLSPDGSPLAACAVGAGLTLVAVHIFGATDAVALGAKVSVLTWALTGLIFAASRLK